MGEALIDLVPPDGESPVSSDRLNIQPGGAPMNVAIGLARLGVESAFLGTLSTDAFGTRLSRLLDGEDIRRSPGRTVDQPTRLAVVDHTNRGEPFRFYGDNPADVQLSRDEVVQAFDDQGATGLYTGSLPLTHPQSRSTLEFAVATARDRGMPVYSDPNPRPAAWPSRFEMVEATEYLLANSILAKLSVDDATALGWPSDPSELIEWAAARFEARIFVTAGQDGCSALIDETLAHIRPPAVTPIDPTGAGDAAFAALIARFHPNATLTTDDLTFAVTVGALATQRQGAVNGLPTRDEVAAFWSG